MPNLTSILAVKLLDGISGPAAKAGKNAKALGQDIQALGKVTAFREASKRLDEMSQALKRARDNAAKAKAAMEAAGNNSKLAAEYQKAASAVEKAKKAFMEQGRAARATRADLSAAGLAVNSLASAEGRLRSSIERTTEVMKRQEAVAKRHAKVRGVLKNAAENAAAAGTYPFIHAGKEAIHSGAEIQHEKVQMSAAGMSAGEIAEATARAWHAQSQYTNVKASDALERWKEARSVLPHQEEVPHLYDTIMQANSAMNIADPSGAMGNSIQYILKAAETLGRTMDPARFKGFMDAAIKAQQVMGKTITPEDIMTSAQQFKTGGVSLSDRFLNTTAMSLTQEMPGGAGAHGVFEATKLLGGSMGHNQERIQAWVDAGLLDPKSIIKNKSGTFHGLKAGKTVFGGREGAKDPDLYTWNKLIPVLEKKGYDTPEKRAPIYNKMFSSTAANVIAKFDQQMVAWKNHAERLNEALGMDATKNVGKDPLAGWNSLKTSLENFAGAVTSPVMERAAGVLSGLSSGIASFGEGLASLAKDYPELTTAGSAATLAGGAYLSGKGGKLLFDKLSGGFGLTASATALDGSAAALTAAAGKLAGGSLAADAAATASSAGSKAAKAGKLALLARGGLQSLALYGASEGLDYADPNGNLWGTTSPADDFVRRHLTHTYGHGGITPGELGRGAYEQTKALMEGSVDGNFPIGEGAANPWPAVKGVGAMVGDKLSSMASKGAQVGEAFGTSVVKGLASHVGDVVQEGQLLIERLKSLFGSTPLEIPVRLNGAQAIGQAKSMSASITNNITIHGAQSPQHAAALSGRELRKAMRATLSDVGLTIAG